MTVARESYTSRYGDGGLSQWLLYFEPSGDRWRVNRFAIKANSASYPQWGWEISTSQSAMMLSGWEVERHGSKIVVRLLKRLCRFSCLNKIRILLFYF